MLNLLSRRTHDEICALLRQRIAELTQERDFYRTEYTRVLGKPLVVQPTERDVRQVTVEAQHDQAQEQAKLLRTGWTHEDFLMFADECEQRVDKSVGADEWWVKRYGYKRPSEVLPVA